MQDIFGQRVQISVVPFDAEFKLTVDLQDFQNTNASGQIQDGLGMTDLFDEPTPFTLDGDKAVNLLYALLLLTLQSQAPGKNDDPEQKIYIAQSGVSVVNFGDRQGQLERRFTVSIFSDGEFNNTADIDAI